MQESVETMQPDDKNQDEIVLLRHWLSLRTVAPLLAFNTLMAVFFAAVHWEVQRQDHLIAWVSSIVALGVLEIGVRLYIARQPSVDLPRWRPIVGTLDLLVGIAWLCAAWYFFSASLLFFYLFSIGAAALCAAVFQHYVLVASFFRVGFALPLAAIQIYDPIEPLGLARSMTVVAIWLGVIWLCTKLHAALRQRLLLVSSRDALLGKVAESAHALELALANEEDTRRQAVSANLAKSRFLAHSSHDLRQPLHATSLLLETIDDELLDAQTRHVIFRVRQSVEMLAKLFDSLLDLTLLDTGQVSIRNRTFNVGALVKEVGEEFSATAIANDVDLVVTDQSLYIHSDITIVRRILQNLVANAIRYAPGERVTIKILPDENNTLALEVRDNGVGIDQQNQQRIFDEFTRVDSPLAMKSQGSLGLGLAIVRRLAKLISTSISLKSEPGRGSSFRLGQFSIEPPPEKSQVMSQSDSRSIVDLCALVVDDDGDTLRATGKLLSKWQLRVILNNGREPLPDEQPAVLICDYELGNDKTGIDIVRQVRQQFSTPIPALLISGNTSPELAEMAAHEKLPLLHKPVRPAQLKSAILTVLGSLRN